MLDLSSMDCFSITQNTVLNKSSNLRLTLSLVYKTHKLKNLYLIYFGPYQAVGFLPFNMVPSHWITAII